MPTLFHTPESVCSQKARIGLAECGLDFESHVVDFAAGEQFSPAFKALNPESVVPVLQDGDIVVRESSIILQYADLVSGAGLMPAGGAARVRAQLLLLQSLNIHDAINSLTFATAIRDIDLKRSAEEREARWARLSNPLTARKRRDLFENGLQSLYVDSAVATVSALIEQSEIAIAADGWLAGSRYSLGDISVFAYFDRLDRLGLAGLWAGRPGMCRWFAANRDRRSYQTAVIDWAGPPPDRKASDALATRWRSVLDAA